MNPVEPARNLPGRNGKVKTPLGETFTAFFRKRARDPRIKGAAFKVFCIILSDSDSNGCSTTALSKIERESGHCRNTVLAAIRRLERANWISVDRHESLGYLTPENVYHILNLPPQFKNCTHRKDRTWRHDSSAYKPRRPQCKK